MSYKILMVEDDIRFQEHLSEVLLDLGFNNSKVASSFAEGKSLYKSYKPDLVILDVNLGEEKTGIDLALELQLSEKSPFIFLTSHYDIDTYTKAKYVSPSHFINKEFSNLDLLQCVELAIFNSARDKTNVVDLIPEHNDLDNTKNIVNRTSNFIFSRTGKFHKKILFKNIIAIEAGGKYCMIHTLEKRYASTKSISNISNLIPSSIFIRVHRRWIVNQELITAINTNTYEVEIENQAFPIGRSYRKELMKTIHSI